MESVTTDKPDASRASDDEHLGLSLTANGFSVIHTYLSKRRYPTCLCMGAPISQGGPQNVKILGPHEAPKC